MRKRATAGPRSRVQSQSRLVPTSPRLSVRWSVPLCLVLASVSAAADRPVDYARDVKHLFQERCFACHGALKQQGKLRLDSGELIHKGGKSGPIVVPGKADDSLLI